MAAENRGVDLEKEEFSEAFCRVRHHLGGADHLPGEKRRVF